MNLAKQLQQHNKTVIAVSVDEFIEKIKPRLIESAKSGYKSVLYREETLKSLGVYPQAYDSTFKSSFTKSTGMSIHPNRCKSIFNYEYTDGVVIGWS